MAICYKLRLNFVCFFKTILFFFFFFFFHNFDFHWNRVSENLVKTGLWNFQNFPLWKVFSLYPNFRFINRLIKETEGQKQRRQNLKDGTEKVCSSNEVVANLLKSFNWKHQGRPRIKAEQLKLFLTVVKLIQNSTAADEHRRTECLRSIAKLDDVHKELTELGFQLSWSALYLRLFPHWWNPSEGKFHANTVPVKPLRPENRLRKKKRRLYVC